MAGAELPARYYRLMEAAVATLDPARLPSAPEARPQSRYYPGALLVAAVLYAQQHPANPRYGQPKLLELALKLGELLAAEHEAGIYVKRADHHRDTYMWLEAWRLLQAKLGQERRSRWRRALEQLIAAMAREVEERRDRPAYTSPFGVATNHTALRASTVHLAGRVFGNPEWERLGAAVMHRYAAVEQSPDGYWGEHSHAGPTTAYDYLTAAGVALYFEHSRDPAALEALRRSTAFHKHFTWPDGQPVMGIDDRRRHAYVSPWAHFGFSHFADGRRYAEFLTSSLREGRLSMEHLGRLAQDALYYHEGPTAPIPPDQPSYVHQMSVPAAIHKTGPWVVSLSGLISTQAVTSRFYLDRQAHLEVFHQGTGLIISGANSKRQPELATFREKIPAGLFHMPLDSRLEMTTAQDRLSLAYNTFVARLEVDPPAGRRLTFRFMAHRKSVPEEAHLTLQLCLKAGLPLETGAGDRVLLGPQPLALERLGGWIRHNGWTLRADPAARLTWPVYPYNPYSNGPEKGLEHAVGALSVPLALRNADRQEIPFALEVSAEESATMDEQAWRRGIRTALFVPEPLPALAAQTHGRFEPAPGVVAERVSYGTQFGLRVPAILYRPQSAAGRAPALIIVNGHGGDKYSWYAFYSGILYARAGAVVLTYDPAGEGERNIDRKSGTRAHDKVEPPRELAQRLAGLMITDVMQAVSYLTQRPEVDARRVAAAGYSMGSFVLSLACAVETRLKACVLVGGGNLDGPGGYWDNAKPMCQGIPYQSLQFLGDRPAALYALHAARGPTLVFNGLEDNTVGILKHGHGEAFFQDLQRRVAALRGTTDGIFETGFVPGVGHRPFFVTRPVALWLERQLDLPNWAEESIRAMPETHIGRWARENAVELDPLYATEHREGGTRALGTGVPGLSRTDLSVFAPGEWEHRKAQLIHEMWLEKAKALIVPR